MKLAIIGSRNLIIENLSNYIKQDVDEIVSGGAKGPDSAAVNYAKEHNIRFTEFLPDYYRYKRSAPLKRNQKIAEYADEALAFWDGSSKGTLYTIALFKKLGKKVTIIKFWIILKKYKVNIIQKNQREEKTSLFFILQ